MINAELIQQCADPRLEVEIVQQFASEIDAADHLTVHVAEGQLQDVDVRARLSELAIGDIIAIDASDSSIFQPEQKSANVSL